LRKRKLANEAKLQTARMVALEKGTAEGVEGAGAGGFGLRHKERGKREREDTDGQVDPEDGPPTEGLGKCATEDGTEREGEAGDCSPDADSPGAGFGVMEGIGNDGERHGVEHGGAEPLHCAEGDECLDGGRGAAEDRTGGEQDEAGLKDPATPNAVRDGAGEHEEAGDDQGIGVEDPLELREAGTEVALNGRQRDVHDGDIHADHEQAGTADGKDEPRVLVTTYGWCRCCLSRGWHVVVRMRGGGGAARNFVTAFAVPGDNTAVNAETRRT
jgi:hypothetical protein